MPQIHLFISGRVQGVFFRRHTHKQATALKLNGWVRNCDNGCVEVFAEGSKEKLETFAAWCHKGPPAAAVEKVEATWSDEANRFGDFRITG